MPLTPLRPEHRRRALLATIATLALTLSACAAAVHGHGSTTAASATSSSAARSSAPPTSSASTSNNQSGTDPTVSPITFSNCNDILDLSGVSFPSGRKAKLTFSCGQVRVPLDYSHPSGATIALDLLKVHDSDNISSKGSLLVNPGGPGGDGLELAVGLATEISDSVLEHYDLVGFDPRGVGLSSPITCTSDAQKDALNAASPQILTTAGFAQAKTLAASTAAACLRKYGSALAQYNTVNTARDMDLVRQAVGDQHMNYLGFSYGTELGAQYAHLFPKKIGVFVLDGAVDPLTDSITSFADQLQGFEGAFDQFAANCLTRSACRSLGNPRQAVYSIVRSVTATPMSTGTSRPLTENLALTGVLEALYSQSEWPALGAALIDAGKGDGSGLLALADEYNQRYSDGTYSNIADANLTISCNDSPPGPTDTQIKNTAAKWTTAYPMFGAWAAPSLFACQSWQPNRTVPPLPTAPTNVTVLVIGNLHDPATPYQGALDLAKTLGNAEVLTWNGEGHTSYLQGSSCIDKYVDNYLVSGTLPPARTTCPQ